MLPYQGQLLQRTNTNDIIKKAGNHMQKRVNAEISSLLVILGILTILIQFGAYYFLDLNIAVWGIACLISVLCCHILLGQSITFSVCFDYSLFTLFISLIVIVLSYTGKDTVFLPYTGIMLGIALINWLLPMLYCFIRYMLNYGSTLEGFPRFYRNSSIVFLVFYTAALLYGNFSVDAFGWDYATASNTAGFIPFTIISAQFSSYLDGSIPLWDIVTYLSSRILVYIPYGFYIFLLLRRRSVLLRCLALLIVPFLIEAVQYFTWNARCNIDDLIYALLGGLLGFLAFIMTNAIYRTFAGRDFLISEGSYRRYGNPLHF